MKLKKYNILNILICLTFLIGLYILSIFYNSHVNLGTTKFFKYDTYKEKSVSIINLGSSHSFYGIKYSSDQAMNLAKDSQDIYYDLQLLKKYSSKIKENAIVIIPISIFSFYSIDDNEINKNYITLLSFEDIKNIKFSEWIMGKYFSVIYPPTRLIKTIKFLIEDGIYKKIFYTERKDLERSKLKEESEETVKRHMKKERDKNGRLIKNAEEDIYNLIEFINQNNWKIVFITTPFSYFYNEGIENIDSNAYKERIYDNIKNLEEKYNKKFLYLDYSHDKRFERNLEYFFDDDHLNEKGAEYFTGILLKNIKKYLDSTE